MFRLFCSVSVLLFVLFNAVPCDSAPMRTSGRRLLDSCGNVFVVRGVEQFLGEQLPQGNNWVGLIDQIAVTGANTVRVLPSTRTLGLRNIDAVLTRIGNHNMVAFLTAAGGGLSWYGRADVKAMLAKHESYLVIDAFGEPAYDDRLRFRREAIAAIQQVRGYGYRVPIVALANHFGRDLPSLLQYGAEIVAADPGRNTILGWQAYWGRSGYYQQRYGMSLTQGVQAVARASFPIQLGIDRVTDSPNETMDFGSVMTSAQANGIGWLWWDWYNPYGRENNLTGNGSASNLLALGQTVVNTHPAGIRNTSVRQCRR